jgi:hypothetical protein
MSRSTPTAVSWPRSGTRALRVSLPPSLGGELGQILPSGREILSSPLELVLSALPALGEEADAHLVDARSQLLDRALESCDFLLRLGELLAPQRGSFLALPPLLGLPFVVAVGAAPSGPGKIAVGVDVDLGAPLPLLLLALGPLGELGQALRADDGRQQDQSRRPDGSPGRPFQRAATPARRAWVCRSAIVWFAAAICSLFFSMRSISCARLGFPG